MKNTTNHKLTALLAVAGLSLATGTSDAVIIFGSAQGGDFFGETGAEIGTNLPTTSTAFNGNRFNGGTRRARNNGGTFFAGNWDFTTTGFGGIDQVRSSGDPGALANSGVTTTGIAYLNDGNNGGTGPVGGGGGGTTQGDTSDDTAPNGLFTATVPTGLTLDYSFNLIDNTDGGSFDYTLELININGGADTLTLATGTFTGPAGSTATATYVPITGSVPVTSDINSFNVRFVLDNSNGGNDQVGIDDIVIDAVPEPSTGLLSLASLGILMLRRRRP